MAEQQSFLSSWQERLTALRNTPPVLKIVWKSGPGVVVFGLVSRLFASLLPLALLWIPKLIVDEITHPKFAAHVMSPRLWWLVASEFGLAVLGGILARAIDYSDSLLADKYTRYVSIQVMKHAAELDLIAYEDPVFYDRLERARVQATDRLGMIQQIGRLIQLVITTTTLSVTIIVYSPWLMLMLIA
jgi:ATP-binding cassette subfamily B protein